MDLKDNIKDIANAPTEMLELLRRIADACETIAEHTAQTKTNTDETALRCEEISGQTQGILNIQTQVLDTQAKVLNRLTTASVHYG